MVNSLSVRVKSFCILLVIIIISCSSYRRRIAVISFFGVTLKSFSFCIGSKIIVVICFVSMFDLNKRSMASREFCVEMSCKFDG